MGFLIKGRRSTETYPQAGGGAAISALRNRSAAQVGQPALPVPFTPATDPALSLIGARLVTPVASGVFMLLAEIILENGATQDSYDASAFFGTGSGLSVSGGNTTMNGWTFGTTTSPTVGGSPVLQAAPIASSVQTLPGTDYTTLTLAGTNLVALPIGVPSVIELLLTEVGGGNSLSEIGISVSLLELP